jgi:hypothetical protein
MQTAPDPDEPMGDQPLATKYIMLKARASVLVMGCGVYLAEQRQAAGGEPKAAHQEAEALAKQIVTEVMPDIIETVK